jgi:filamentous hemagglutinin
VINESVRQSGTDITAGGNVTVIAGRDVTAQAADVYAAGNTAVAAGRDITLSTATESDYAYREEKKTSGGSSARKPLTPSTKRRIRVRKVRSFPVTTLLSGLVTT